MCVPHSSSLPSPLLDFFRSALHPERPTAFPLPIPAALLLPPGPHERISPQEKASFVSKAWFAWVFPILVLAKKKGIQEEVREWQGGDGTQENRRASAVSPWNQAADAGFAAAAQATLPTQPALLTQPPVGCIPVASEHERRAAAGRF